jgi:hypothetical protein
MLAEEKTTMETKGFLVTEMNDTEKANLLSQTRQSV